MPKNKNNKTNNTGASSGNVYVPFNLTGLNKLIGTTVQQSIGIVMDPLGTAGVNSSKSKKKNKAGVGNNMTAEEEQKRFGAATGTYNSNSTSNYSKKVANNEGSMATLSDGTEIPFEDGDASNNILKTIEKKGDKKSTDESGEENLYSLIDMNGPDPSGGYSDMAASLSHYMHLPAPGETYHDRMYDSIFRFGAFNTNTFTTGREYLFFTKPDLNIFKVDDAYGQIILGDNNLPQLNPGLRNGFWQDIAASKKRIIEQLQYSYAKYKAGNGVPDPFCHLLSNQCISNLDIPSLSANTVETSTNMYGVGFAYRGSSEESDDQVEFSLEFKDTRWLDIYYYFKAFEEYETEKHHGTVRPWKQYIMDKIIHDQFAIYKFVVDDDMETLIYWGKMYGVMPMSLPRDTFSTDNFENGLTYSINFKAAFYEDMRPEILSEFNNLGKALWDHFDPSKNKGYDIGIYNPILGRTDGRWPKAARILYVDGSDGKDKKAFKSPNGYRYKLAWRGDTKV